MLKEVQIQALKAGQSPGQLTPASKKSFPTHIRVLNYSKDQCSEVADASINEALKPIPEGITRWIHIEGFKELEVFSSLQERFKIHPLTSEDILNSMQRPKTEEFENYVFVTLKVLSYKKTQHNFRIGQVSMILGENFVLTFSDRPVNIFTGIRKKLQDNPNQRLRGQKADYLFYRLIDTIIDQYFVILEGVGEKIDKVETLIIDNPIRTHTKLLYQLKRKTLTLRKAVWPIREAVNHLSEVNEKFIGQFTRTYLRDVYDHVVQAIDTIETYRDMLSSMLDVYLSSITNHLNEIMKTLTVISTIFIPITFIASLYGMNFINMPELKWKYGYEYACILMLTSIVMMVVYFKRKKWF